MDDIKGTDTMQDLLGVFENAHLKAGTYEGIPYVPNETGKSHFFRILDHLNPEISQGASTNAICKEVILTLLNCASMLLSNKGNSQEAMDLIKNKDTMAILYLAIQDDLSHVIYQKCSEGLKYSRLNETDSRNYPHRAGLFSAVRRILAGQMTRQAKVIEHISSLCFSHSNALENISNKLGIDERVMFENYVTLVEPLDYHEKSWLVKLLPDTFQWEAQDGCDHTNASAKELAEECPVSIGKEEVSSLEKLNAPSGCSVTQPPNTIPFSCGHQRCMNYRIISPPNSNSSFGDSHIITQSCDDIQEAIYSIDDSMQSTFAKYDGPLTADYKNLASTAALACVANRAGSGDVLAKDMAASHEEYYTRNQSILLESDGDGDSDYFDVNNDMFPLSPDFSDSMSSDEDLCVPMA
ncbi:hypothetical protein F5884DRAFT_757634 [Xylogone sp. PMI_703]|nr:hypothetical protein F5884DRAFT_757634 [Xylogone sp. PMI_703]